MINFEGVQYNKQLIYLSIETDELPILIAMQTASIRSKIHFYRETGEPYLMLTDVCDNALTDLELSFFVMDAYALISICLALKLDYSFRVYPDMVQRLQKLPKIYRELFNDHLYQL